jgi:hypothetical protein
LALSLGTGCCAVGAGLDIGNAGANICKYNYLYSYIWSSAMVTEPHKKGLHTSYNSLLHQHGVAFDESTINFQHNTENYMNFILNNYCQIIIQAALRWMYVYKS